MEIYESPELQPYKCAGCGSGAKDGRGYIDFGIDFIDFYGALYLCGVCFDEAARKMDYVSYKELNEAQNNHKGLISEFDEAQDEIRRLKDVINSYNNMFSYHSINVDNNTTFAVPSTFEVTNVSAGVKGSGKSGTTESTSKSRRKDIPDTSEGDDESDTDN